MVTLRQPEYLTDALTREALGFIERHRQGPFFLYLAYNAVHSPMQGTARYMERFERIPDIHRRVFAAMLANLDDSVGAVLEKLRDCGLEEDSLIFLLSDNGGPTAETTSHNDPLRGGKGTKYEGGIRIPMMVQWKGTLPAGRVYARPVISLDIFATASAAAGAALPSDRPIDGVDLRDTLCGRGPAEPHDCLFWRYGGLGALRQADWKLVLRPGGKKGKPVAELFDLAADLGEKHDLAATRPDKLRELRAQWQRHNAQMVPSRW